MKIRIAIAFLAIALIGHSQITLNTTVSTIPHEWSSLNQWVIDYPIGDFYGAVRAPAFSIDLSDIDTLSWTISAPSGFRFIFERPSGSPATGAAFSVIWHAGGSLGTWSSSQSTNVSFENLTGGFVSDSVTLSISSTGDGVKLEGGFGLVEPVSFTSMTITSDFSNVTERSAWDYGTFEPDLSSRFYVLSTGASSSDLGPTVTLAAIPEPSTFATLAGVIALCAGLRKRTNRRQHKTSGLEGVLPKG